ncbi:hypothetical protein JR316_0002672 [Psilocybe cubensis]|uniref:Uncharacterized protein n=2 Tax=Psilocybe cubensis TaxID=181762 RepID=A0A8H7Y953_PSICU|nr:hypothetical protein JR316_0002672 [Psilocybe cubensis]KAH9485757.1 hypothetical protein JR316_0002672 [Psilocybe cubensis]
MTPIRIQDLALELVQEIVLYVSQDWDKSFSREELGRLRLVSRPFKAVVDPLLFSEVRFDFIRRPVVGVLQQLNDLAFHMTSVNRHIKTLKIESTEIHLSGPIAHGKYGFLLMNALKSLVNVRSIYWTLDRFEGIYTVLDGIVDLPLLEDIRFEFSTLPLLWQTTDMINLRRFAHLNSVGFRCRNASAPLAASFIQQLRLISSYKQTLQSLEIDFSDVVEGNLLGSDEVYPKHSILHELVRSIPQGTTLRLKHLRVSGWNFLLDSSTVPHLRCLSSLNIASMEDTSSDHQMHIWHGMIKAGIQLQKIITAAISKPLIRYLASYTGLVELKFAYRMTNFEFTDDSDSSDALTAELCHSALPVHKKTLKIFEMLDRSDKSRCITLDTISAIRTYERLESLTITVRVEELDYPENIKQIIIMALEIPHLRILDIDYSRPRVIGHRCQCGNARRIRQTNDKFEAIITSIDVLRQFTRSLGSTQIIFNRKRYIAKVVENGRVQFQPESRLARSGKWVSIEE